MRPSNIWYRVCLNRTYPGITQLIQFVIFKKHHFLWTCFCWYYFQILIQIFIILCVNKVNNSMVTLCSRLFYEIIYLLSILTYVLSIILHSSLEIMGSANLSGQHLGVQVTSIPGSIPNGYFKFETLSSFIVHWIKVIFSLNIMHLVFTIKQIFCT